MSNVQTISALPGFPPRFYDPPLILVVFKQLRYRMVDLQPGPMWFRFRPIKWASIRYYRLEFTGKLNRFLSRGIDRLYSQRLWLPRTFQVIIKRDLLFLAP